MLDLTDEGFRSGAGSPNLLVFDLRNFVFTRNTAGSAQNLNCIIKLEIKQTRHILKAHASKQKRKRPSLPFFFFIIFFERRRRPIFSVKYGKRWT